MEIEAEVKATAEMWGFPISHIMYSIKSRLLSSDLVLKFTLDDTRNIPVWQPKQVEIEMSCIRGKEAATARNGSRVFFLNMAHGHAYKMLNKVAGLRQTPNTGFFWPKVGEAVSTVEEHRLQLCERGYHLVGMYGLPYWSGEIANEVFPISRRIVHGDDKFVVSSAVVGKHSKELHEEHQGQALHHFLAMLIGNDSFGKYNEGIEEYVLPAVENPMAFLGAAGYKARKYLARINATIAKTGEPVFANVIRSMITIMDSQYILSDYIHELLCNIDRFLLSNTFNYLGYQLTASEIYSCIYYQKVFNERAIYA